MDNIVYFFASHVSGRHSANSVRDGALRVPCRSCHAAVIEELALDDVLLGNSLMGGAVI